MAKLALPTKLTPKQQEIDDSPARFKIVDAARRFGKTKYMPFWTVREALTNGEKDPKAKPAAHWHVSKTMELIRDEFWPELLRITPEQYIVKVDNVRLKIHLKTPNGRSIISCKSADKPDNLRGRGLRSLSGDEVAFWRMSIWDNVLRPMLGDSKGKALLCSSHKTGWFSSLYKQAREGKAGTDWAGFMATIYDNPHFPPDEIESIKNSLINTGKEYIWRIEYLCEDVEGFGAVYELNRRSIYDPGHAFEAARSWPTVIGIDYGLNDDTGIIWLHINPEGRAVFSQEHSKNGWDVSRHATVVKDGSIGIRSPHYVLDQVNFRRDPTSRLSVADLFRQNGINCARSERDKNAGVDVFRRYLRGDGINPWLYISSSCPKLIEAVQEWENEGHEPDILAAARYALTYAIERGMTALAKLIPSTHRSSLSNSDSTDPVALAHAGRVMIPRLARTNKKSSWSWDYQAGAPY